jgi:hypothetical protein
MEDQWLRPLKIIEDMAHLFNNADDAEKELYLAVIRGEVRARSKGIVLGPEWLKQLSKLKVHDTNPFALPPDIQASVDDTRKVWGY